jgi:cytochrome o ubiquinol oxidase subunit 2
MKGSAYFLFIGLPSLCAAVLLGGCRGVQLLHPEGPIGNGNLFVILMAIGLMLIVVVPVFIMHFLFARRYRATNPKGKYTPKWSYSGAIDLVIWLVPIAIVTCLAILSWTKTHDLDPYKPIDPAKKPISIEVVALDWKYLFIYPDHDIATVNQLAFPAGVPLSFRLTSDTVMTSFFIPRLGSQIYAMAGRQTRLHLMADEPGVYHGHNQQLSGIGYSDMHFQAIAVSLEKFQAWVQKIKQSPDKLDLARFEKLAKPSIGHPVMSFSSVVPNLFEQIIRKYNPTWGKEPATGGEKRFAAHEKAGALEGR